MKKFILISLLFITVSCSKTEIRDDTTCFVIVDIYKDCTQSKTVTYHVETFSMFHQRQAFSFTDSIGKYQIGQPLRFY